MPKTFCQERIITNDLLMCTTCNLWETIICHHRTDALILRRRLKKIDHPTETFVPLCPDRQHFITESNCSWSFSAKNSFEAPLLPFLDDSRNTTTKEREIATETTNYIWNWSVWFTQDQYYQGGSVFRWMWKKAICTFTLQITDAADLLKSLAVSAIITNQQMSPGGVGAERTSY